MQKNDLTYIHILFIITTYIEETLKRSSKKQMLFRELPAGARQKVFISELALEFFCGSAG